MFQGQGHMMMRSPFQLPAMAQNPQAIATPLALQAITPPAQAHTPGCGVKTAPVRSSGQQAGGKKIPRPSNAWIMYRKHHHASFVAANQGLTNNDICKSFHS
jgi:hypothetical protein